MKRIQHFLMALLLLSGVHSSGQTQRPRATPEPRPTWSPASTPTRIPREQRFRPLLPVAPRPLLTPPNQRAPFLKRPPAPPESAFDKIKRQVVSWWASTKARWQRKLDRYREHPASAIAEHPGQEMAHSALHAFWDDVLKPLLKGIWLLLLYPLWQGIKRVFSKDA